MEATAAEFQNLVSGGVAEGLIEGLKVLDFNHQNGERLFAILEDDFTQNLFEVFARFD